MHHAFDRVGSFRAIEFFLVGLLPTRDRHRKNLFAEVGVNAQHPFGFFPCLLRGGMHGMPLLPEKLPVAQERTGGFFPSEARCTIGCTSSEDPGVTG
jgi:hypothetical protein